MNLSNTAIKTSSQLLLLCLIMFSLFGFNSYKKSNLIKQESDTIVVTGNLVDAYKKPFLSKRVDLYPVNKNNESLLIINKEGLYGNPSVPTDDNGFFRILFHKKIISENNAFTLKVLISGKYKPLLTEDGGSLVFKIDSTSRVINVGVIIVKP